MLEVYITGNSLQISVFCVKSIYIRHIAMAGLFTSSEAMAEQISAAARIAGEKVWRLPLVERYNAL